jgi:hypothetical protein
MRPDDLIFFSSALLRRYFYGLMKDFNMLDSVGTTELLAATLYDKFVSDGLNS